MPKQSKNSRICAHSENNSWRSGVPVSVCRVKGEWSIESRVSGPWSKFEEDQNLSNMRGKEEQNRGLAMGEKG
jgi:hypothetical protein